MSGYVRIHRPLFEDHPAFRNDAEAMAFAWLIVKAAWKPTKVRYKCHDIWLDRGQLTISVRDMAQKFDRPKGWVERLIARLREANMITVKNGTQVRTQVGTRGGTHGGTAASIITICNYNEYQADIGPRETVNETPDETGAGQTQDTEQVREEVKKESNSASQSLLRAAVSEAVSFYNSTARECGWKAVLKLSAAREAGIRARLKDHGLDGWKAAIARARASPFLGRDPPHWFNFDFLIGETKFLKVIEGNYDRRHSTDTDPTTDALRLASGG